MALRPRLPKLAFDAVLQKLARVNELALEGAFVRLPSHEVRLTAEDMGAWETVAPLLGGTERFRPPRVRDIAAATGRAEAEVQRILKRVGRMGWADEVAHDHFFLRSTVREMVGIAADLTAGARHAGFSAAEFRDRTASGRKVAIQILEFFDRRGVTLRKGDLRRINRARLDLFGLLAEAHGGCAWRRIVPGGAPGLQIRVGQRACLRWVRLPLSSASLQACGLYSTTITGVPGSTLPMIAAHGSLSRMRSRMAGAA